MAAVLLEKKQYGISQTSKMFSMRLQAQKTDWV